MDINDLPQNLEETSSRNPIYRFITAWSKWNLPLKISSMLVVLTVVATGIYYTLATTGQIAFLGIGPTPTPVPVTPPITPPFSPSPYPSPSFTTCVSRVKTATVSLPCSTQGFYKVIYQCDDGRNFTMGDGRTCIDIFSAGYQARDKCGTTCTSPSVPPSPRVCQYETGTCVTRQNTCLTYNDSCAKEDFCSFPIQQCNLPSPSPSLTPSPTPSSYFTCIYQCVVKSRQSIAACREICKR